MNLVMYVFIKSHKNTNECLEWPIQPQSRGLKLMVRIMRLLVEKVFGILGIITLICVFSCMCPYCCHLLACAICLHVPLLLYLLPVQQVAAKWAISIPVKLFADHSGILQKKGTGKILRASRRGVVLEEVIERTWLPVDLHGGPGQFEASQPLLCPWNVCLPTIPMLEALLKILSWEGNMFLAPSGLNAGLNPVKALYINF